TEKRRVGAACGGIEMRRYSGKVSLTEEVEAMCGGWPDSQRRRELLSPSPSKWWWVLMVDVGRDDE
ncbi:hypothetical protein A2U01_0058165, partial [Trifolium medium]|nr:hypothetical protein [Trifolium medium]